MPLTKRPLLATRADQNLLVLDDSRTAILNAAKRHRNVLVVGGPGSGKTSILNAIMAQLDEQVDPETAAPLAIYLNARGAENSFHLVAQLVWQAAEVGWIEQPPAPNAQDPFAMATLLRQLQSAPANSLVLVDDPTPEQVSSVFGRFRDELWMLPIAFLVAAGEQAATAAATPPVDAFFDDVFTLEPFGPGEAFEMLRRRKDVGQFDGAILEPQNPLQPRAILLDAEAGPTGIRHDAELQAELMERASDAAGRTGAMLLAEVWNGGAVSASDTDLQKRLGVTRSRLTQLLKELERAGVLVIIHSPPVEGTIGRPKVMYDVKRTS